MSLQVAYPIPNWNLPVITKISNSLGSAALDTTPVSLSITNEIFDTESKNIKFMYPLTPVGPLLESDYPLPTSIDIRPDYEPLDNQLETQMRINKYFYERMFNKWIFNEYKKLLHIFKINGKTINKVKNNKEFKKNKLSNSEKQKIVKYIVNNIYDKYDLKKSLKSFSRRSGLRLVDLVDYKDRVKIHIYRDLKKKIQEM
jgi:hypothetical protein